MENDSAPYLREESPPNSMEEDDDDDDEEYRTADATLSLDEVLYSASSYHAICKPVALTMILSALCVTHIWTDQSRSMGAQEMASYEAFKIDDSSSSSVWENGVRALVNALIIVTFIGTMTFGIVLLYKYRCMKCLVGYMVFASATLLGMLGGTMFDTAIERYRIPIDKLSFYFVVFNFAIVGTTSIFFGRGIPTYITQGYLIATSVILAWQLSNFNPYMAWSLLVMLALYDLCAVLSPCGPLKALVNLMQEKDSPDMPGLLYEAHLPPGTRRLSRQNTSNVTNHSTSTHATTSQQQQSTMTTTIPEAENSEETTILDADDSEDASATLTTPLTRSPSRSVESHTSSTSPHKLINDAPQPVMNVPSTTQSTSNVIPSTLIPNTTEEEEETRSTTTSNTITAFIPLAIARVYKLPLVVSTTNRTTRLESTTTTNVSTAPLLLDETSSPSIAELRADVQVQFPRNGGRIERQQQREGGVGDVPRYHVYGRDGQLRRVLMVDRQGRVLEETEEQDDDEDDTPASIKLGLGDFIFYSLLVAQAALYGFTTFLACMLVILAGLGGTLVLLSVYHTALPALPISIFLGVVFYLLTRVVIEPWIYALLTTPFYA